MKDCLNNEVVCRLVREECNWGWNSLGENAIVIDNSDPIDLLKDMQ